MTTTTTRPERQARASAPRGSRAPLWWLVFRREFLDLWTGGKVIILLVLFAAVMSVTSVLRELESKLSLIPPTEMIFLTILAAISFGLFVGMVIGADTISGERERATLEPLLLAPGTRRQIVLGKFLAAMSPWPVTVLLSLPYVIVLARGDKALGEALLLGTYLGGVLAVAFTGFGMIVSIWSRSNRTSLFVSLVVYLIFLIPTQWPGNAQKGDLGYLVQQLDPMQASSEFLEKVIVNNRTVAEKAPYLYAAILSAVLVLVALFGYSAPRLTLDGDRPGAARFARRGPSAGAVAMALALLPGTAVPTGAAGSVAHPIPAVVSVLAADSTGLTISNDVKYKSVNAGDEVDFTTVVTNGGTAASPDLNVAMNIVKTGKGDPVDPEDWSPERTQQVAALGAGETAELSWVVAAIMEGDYLVYITVLPKPAGVAATSSPVASPALHLTVKAFAKSNPGGVLPVAIATPLVLLAIALIPRRRWWRRGQPPAPVEREKVDA